MTTHSLRTDTAAVAATLSINALARPLLDRLLDRLLQLGRHVPAVTIVIDSPERIAAAFAVVDDLTDEQGLVTSEVVPAMRPGGDPQARGGIPLG